MDPAQSTLVVLLQSARGGDAAAREQLFARCRNYVQLIARTHVERRLQAKVDASDLVQQTLLEAHRGFERFQGATEQEWLAWLRRILAHNATDFLRQQGTEKRQARREVPLDASPHAEMEGLVPQLAAPGETPSQIVIRHEQELQVADALTQLPDDYQEVVALRNLHRLPFEEIAQRMGRSVGAVQMLWLRAIKKLQEELDVPAPS